MMINTHSEDALDHSHLVVETPSRLNRALLLAGFVITTPLITTVTAPWLAGQFFPDDSLISSISMVVGFCTSIPLVGTAVEKFFLIRNSTTGMFVTQDTLRSLLGKSAINVSYMPGTHISFPWERRIAGNNILLEDAPIEFSFEVLRVDGILFGKGSYRMRPDPNNPVTFLSSVAAVGEEVRDLIIAEIQSFFKEESAIESATKLTELNEHLKEVFVKALAELEKNNGVIVSDATVSKLLPSEELQRTLSGISEADAIHAAVLKQLGMKDQTQLNRALKRGSLTHDDVKRVQDNILAITGNMDNIKIERRDFNLNVSGLSPETVNAVTELAKTPVAQAAATAAASRARSSGPKKGTKK
jgi:hypothetical protein